ncbi:MAG: hypothetical protein ACKO13_11265 [Cytophagales bacterium]
MKKFYIMIWICALATVSFGQRQISDDTPKTFKERGYFGGGFGLSGGRDAFGNNYFFIALNPIIGYMVKPEFSVGSGLNWQRTSYSDQGISLDQYGVSPFARYNFGGQLFGYAEYNYISTPTFINRNERRSFNRMLLGLGYSQPLGGRGAINAVALYDLLYNQADRAFTSPWVFRVFFSF